ncbi:vWA domain-containing protein [Ornithinimicrobium cryptoxanthini]|uniref:VWA domain-containing protein n=1 Tax=Ornithinimicrobium cryptoxanthini TaxID=2934161 RepID=A0ABY4YG26_9MICO|nr:VWA domain-containing protein [Ornithinimicrobium cryptoxanthini]USQ75683.1 VWA domain-containing protein [Ornithinimicrobium cryptoxanthini]
MTRPTARCAATALATMLSTALLATPALATAPGTATAPATGTTPDTTASTDGQLLLVLDASGSMRDEDGAGTPKIEGARSALDAVINDLGDDQQVGLRLFASTESESDTAAACADSELVVPVGTGNQAALSAAVQDYEPYGGETPIGYALQEAATDLGSDGQRSILLVSDGISTCDPDPCEVAEDLTQDGIELAIHVVGLDVDSEAREQLQCIAEAGNGTYIDAADTDTLTSALTQMSTRAFRPFSVAGDPVVGTTDPATAPTVGEGQFTDTMPINQDTPKFYRLQRTTPGSTLHVGVTMRPEAGGLGSYRMWLESPDGDSCGTIHGSPWSAGAGNSFGTAGVSSARYGDDGPCQEDDEVILRLELQGGSEELQDGQFEMVVREEPPVSNADELPGVAPRSEWQELEPGEPVGDVVGGSSLNDAPRIEPGGTYSSEITRGEIVFFRVPVDYGQRLQALVEFPRPTGVFADTTSGASDIADVVIVGPTRSAAEDLIARAGDLRRRAIIYDDRAVQAAVTTHEVRWANRTSGNQLGSALAGDYWVGVSLTSNSEVRPTVPFTLTTEVFGEVSGEPAYADPSSADDVTTATAEPAETSVDTSEERSAPAPEEATEDTAAAPPVAATDDGAPLGLIVGLAALGMALLVAGGFVLARAMRT